MTALEIYKIAVDAQPRDTRLNKYQEYLERDILHSAKQGKFSHKVNYSDRPLTEEFVFLIHERLKSNGFEVIPSEDITKFREFVVEWDDVNE